MDFLELCSCYVVKCHDVMICMSLVTSFSLLRIVHADWKQCLKKTSSALSVMAKEKWC